MVDEIQFDKKELLIENDSEYSKSDYYDELSDKIVFVPKHEKLSKNHNTAPGHTQNTVKSPLFKNSKKGFKIDFEEEYQKTEPTKVSFSGPMSPNQSRKLKLFKTESEAKKQAVSQSLSITGGSLTAMLKSPLGKTGVKVDQMGFLPKLDKFN